MVHRPVACVPLSLVRSGQMNELPPHKRSLLKRMLACGASVRNIASAVPCSMNTVKRYADMWTLSVQCGCGKPAGHNGWCSVRLDFSPARRGWLRDRWKKRGDSDIRRVVDDATAAAQSRGHQLGQFMWASATAASFAFALCRTCGKEVRIYTNQSQWERFADWQRFAGGAVTQQCRTEEQRAAEQAVREEKRSWLEGKRTLLELRRTLRGRSNSPRGASTQAQTSRR